MQDYEIRKHYEAALVDLANVYQIVSPRTLRENFKTFLIEEELIEFSTTELDDEAFKLIADQITIHVTRVKETPTERRGILDRNTFENILKIEIHEKS